MQHITIQLKIYLWKKKEETINIFTKLSLPTLHLKHQRQSTVQAKRNKLFIVLAKKAILNVWLIFWKNLFTLKVLFICTETVVSPKLSALRIFFQRNLWISLELHVFYTNNIASIHRPKHLAFCKHSVFILDSLFEK